MKPNITKFAYGLLLTMIAVNSLPASADDAEPASIGILDTSIRSGASIREIGWMVWHLDTPARLIENASFATLKNPDGKNVATGRLSVWTDDGEYYLRGDFCDELTGAVYVPAPGLDYTISLPAGVLRSIEDQAVVSAAHKTSVFVLPPLTGTVETSSITLRLQNTNGGGTHTLGFESVKGEPLTINSDAGEEWNFQPIYMGKQLDKNDNGYILPELDATVAVNLRLSHASEMEMDSLTGAAIVPGTSVKVFPDGNMIVIEGMAPADRISIHSPAGLLIKEILAEPDDERLHISASPGDYIVMVNGHGTIVSL